MYLEKVEESSTLMAAENQVGSGGSHLLSENTKHHLEELDWPTPLGWVISLTVSQASLPTSVPTFLRFLWLNGRKSSGQIRKSLRSEFFCCIILCWFCTHTFGHVGSSLFRYCLWNTERFPQSSSSRRDSDRLRPVQTHWSLPFNGKCQHEAGRWSHGYQLFCHR